MSDTRYIHPQPGPQTIFATSTADIAIFSGQPGSGKTGALVFELGRWSHVEHYSGIAFRRLARDLVGEGSLWNLAKKWWRHTGARLPQHTAYWDATSSSVQFDHLQYESDVSAHDGHEYAVIAFDELPHFEQSQFDYLAYTRNRSTCGVRSYVRASTMAAPDTWVHAMVKGWLLPDGWPNFQMSGVVRWFLRSPFSDEIVWFDKQEDADALAWEFRKNDPTWKGKPKSFTVVHSVTEDNAILTASNPDYASGFANLTRDERLRKLGNWEARPPSSGMFDRQWFKVFDRVDVSQIAFSVRAWDKASTLPNDKDAESENHDPDWTRGVLMHFMKNGMIIVADVVSCRDRPAVVDLLYSKTAECDGPLCTQAFWRDPGQGGDVDEEHTKQVLRKVSGCGAVEFVREAKNKVAYAIPVAAYADPTTPGSMGIVRGTWNGEYLSELSVFPLDKSSSGAKYKKDQVDATSRGFLEIDKRRNGAGGWAQAMRGVRL